MEARGSTRPEAMGEPGGGRGVERDSRGDGRREGGTHCGSFMRTGRRERLQTLVSGPAGGVGRIEPFADRAETRRGPRCRIQLHGGGGIRLSRGRSRPHWGRLQGRRGESPPLRRAEGRDERRRVQRPDRVETRPGPAAILNACAVPTLGAVAGSCATAARESSQGRKAAALSGYGRVPQPTWPPHRAPAGAV